MLTPLKQGTRKNGGVANLTTTSTALMATGNFGVHIPMPIRNNVARLQDRNEDLNFDHEETINGSPRLVYKPMGLFMHDRCLCGRSDETHQRDDRSIALLLLFVCSGGRRIFFMHKP
jgi:hypothetical protein